MRGLTLVAVLCALHALGCGTKSSSQHESGEGGASGLGPGTVGTSDAEAPDTSTGQIEIGDSGLPDLPPLTNVVALQREDSVGIDFDPVEGAVDYRVYPLPSADQIINNGDGSLTIKNAIYRCAGLRQGYDLENDTNDPDAGGMVRDGGLSAFDMPVSWEAGSPIPAVPAGPGLSLYNAPFNWKASTVDTPTLGHVYPTSGAGLVPVYAVAGYPMQIELGWRESRLKIYTTDATQRATLLSQNWRDDGIVFYVPSAAGPSTQTIYSSQNQGPWSCQGCNSIQHQQYFFTAADMAKHMSDTVPPAPAFQVLTAATAGTQPLMAVLYSSDQVHTELAVGTERYNRALNQGDGPLWHVEWAGLTGPTTLVVEALKSGCPYQGFLSAQHLEAPPHQTLYTLGDLQAASSTGEVFINGEYDDVPASPVPVARSFVQVAPQPHNPADWDWYQGFDVGTSLSATTMLVDTSNGSKSSMCTWLGCLEANTAFQVASYELDAPSNVPLFTWGQFQGQLWEAFDDTGQDVTGRVRFSAIPTATVAADTYVHVAMSVNMVSDDRRYPQIIISDQPAPVDCYFQPECGGNGNGIGNANSNVMVIQPITGPPMRVEVEAFHGLVGGNQWNVNNQAPEHRFLDSDPDSALSDAQWAALNPGGDPPFEHAGMDRMTRFDAFVSTERLYLFMDGAPAGCTQFPGNWSMAPGPITITFGDVLYHELAPDEVCGDPRVFHFANRHQCTETSRHFDDLGFKSRVAAPAAPVSGPAAVVGSTFTWNETKLPCAAY
jgi:hypothetical protein